MNVDIVHAVYARLENRPGSLERLARTLSEHRINIDAISAETYGDQGFVRVLVTKPREAVEALKKAGLEAFESQLVVAPIPNRPGELARAASELAAAQLNIEGIVTTADGKLAIRTNDADRAAQIFRKL